MASTVENAVQTQLLALQDPKYRDFQCKLMPTVARESVIGIRTPALRAFAKAFAKTPEASQFLQILPHRYYEENNLHAFLIELCKDYAAVLAYLDAFLPYVDNWATCDVMHPKVFCKHLDSLREKIRQWIHAEHTYTIRFGVGMLMSFYLEDAFEPAYLEEVSRIQSSEYYVNMMIAWYFATALAKQYEATLPYIQAKKLDEWTHNKTIQKAVESYRISDAQKEYLRALKIK